MKRSTRSHCALIRIIIIVITGIIKYLDAHRAEKVDFVKESRVLLDYIAKLRIGEPAMAPAVQSAYAGGGIVSQKFAASVVKELHQHSCSVQSSAAHPASSFALMSNMTC